MYSKNDSVPPGAISRSKVPRIRSTSSTPKLFSGRPEIDVVEAAGVGQFFDRLMKNPRLAGDPSKGLFVAKSPLQMLNELVVQFDQRQIVAGLQPLDERPGHGAGSRPNFEDFPRSALAGRLVKLPR